VTAKTPLDQIKERKSPLYQHAAWFMQSLRASARAQGTITSYLGAVNEYDRLAERTGMPRDLAHIDRQCVETFMLDQLERLSPATAAARYAGVRAFFTWAVDQQQIGASPLGNMKPPVIPEVPVPVLTVDQVRALVKACEGKAYKQRRDMALIRFLLNTGVRRSECAAIRLKDLDLPAGEVAIVKGKGGRGRVVSFDAKTATAIYAYLIERDKQSHVSSPFLWIGQMGGLSGDAVGSIFARRARIAGVLNMSEDGTSRPSHVHQARHTFADRFLAAGGQEGELMKLGGWRSREIMSRYASSRASERAIESSKRLAIGDAY